MDIEKIKRLIERRRQIYRELREDRLIDSQELMFKFQALEDIENDLKEYNE